MEYYTEENMTLECLIEKNLQRYPDKTAVLYQDQACSFRQLNDLSRRLADFFLEQGMEKGSRGKIQWN